MDTPFLFDPQQASTQPSTRGLGSRGLHSRRGANHPPTRILPVPGPGVARGDGLGHDAGLRIGDEFQAIVYQSQVQQASLSARMQQAAQKAAPQENPAGAVSGEAAQLNFDFFAEVRVEQVTFFRQRTTTVAEGLDGAQHESFVETSMRIAARFEFSMSVSGQVLEGFAGAAEGLNGGQGIDDLVTLSKELMAQADEVMNEIFALLDGFFNWGGDLQDRITSLLDAFQNFSLDGIPSLEGIPFEGVPGAGEGGVKGAFLVGGSFQMQLEFKFEFSLEIEVTQGEVQESDPIVLDLDGDGIELTSYRDGARFDIEGAGRKVNTAFVTGGDAFLAIDRNGNGVIDDGTELFGDQRGAANGFEELRKLDSNNDGVINALDSGFDQLLLFKDNGDGKTDAGELMTLSQAGIREIALGYRDVNEVAAGGNRITQVASFVRDDGSRGRAADAVLNFTV